MASTLAAGVAIVPMRWWHLESVFHIEEDIFSDEPWTPSMFWSELAEYETRSYFVATAASTNSVPNRADDDIIGYAGLCVYPEEAFVQTIAVRRDWQRQGVGTLLLRTLIGQASSRGAPRLELEVRADNYVAQHLYETHGFRRVGVRKGYYQHGRTDAVLMSLDLLRHHSGNERRP